MSVIEKREEEAREFSRDVWNALGARYAGKSVIQEMQRLELKKLRREMVGNEQVVATGPLKPQELRGVGGSTVVFDEIFERLAERPEEKHGGTRQAGRSLRTNHTGTPTTNPTEPTGKPNAQCGYARTILLCRVSPPRCIARR